MIRKPKVLWKITSCKKCHMAFFYFSILCILILNMEIKQKCIKNGKIMGGNENNEEIDDVSYQYLDVVKEEK